MLKFKLIGVILSILVIGLFGVYSKITRYTTPHLSKPVLAENTISENLMKRGWTMDKRIPITSDGSYSALIFKKESCSPIAISVLGSEESNQSAINVIGNNLSYLEDGKIKNIPSFEKFQINASWNSIFALFHNQQDTTMPIIAIWPKQSLIKSDTDKQCSQLEADFWKQLRYTNKES